MTEHVITALANGGLSGFANMVSAIGALGGASMGLVDTSKAFGGGPSNFGFGHIESTLAPFLDALAPSSATLNKQSIVQMMKSDWLNGVAKEEQKARAKSLIHLGLSQSNATALANVAEVDASKLQAAMQKTIGGQPAAADEASALSRFDAMLTVTLDAAYERGDQQYRNAAKFLAMATSVVLGVIGGLIVFGTDLTDLTFCMMAGLVATPLAPVAKDLVSALQTANAATAALRQ